MRYMTLFNGKFGHLQRSERSASMFVHNLDVQTDVAIDDVVIFSILNNLEDLKDHSVNLGTGTSDDDDVLLRLAQADVDGRVLAKDRPQDRTRWSNDVPVPLLWHVQSLGLDVGSLLSKVLQCVGGSGQGVPEFGVLLLFVTGLFTSVHQEDG